MKRKIAIVIAAMISFCGCSKPMQQQCFTNEDSKITSEQVFSAIDGEFEISDSFVSSDGKDVDVKASEGFTSKVATYSENGECEQIYFFVDALNGEEMAEYIEYVYSAAELIGVPPERLAADILANEDSLVSLQNDGIVIKTINDVKCSYMIDLDKMLYVYNFELSD